MNSTQTAPKPCVLIIGGGFGGMQVAKRLKNANVDVLLLDKHNYHTFQPLLYQVAMGDIAADSIGFPVRRIFTNQKNFTFHLAEVKQINPDTKTVDSNLGTYKYDYLVIATGANTNYFGNKEIEFHTMPMKNIPEALNIRSLVQQNLEKALVTVDEREREALLTFVVVGGGPTGVELSGALGEMRKHVLCKDFPGLCKEDMKVYLVEGKDRVLGAMSEQASIKAKQFLNELNVECHNGVHVQSYDGLTLKIDDGTVLETKGVFWAAGVRGEVPAGMPAATITRGTRIQTDEINRVVGYQNIFAIGDVAFLATDEFKDGLPGVAPVAIQQGAHVAKNIANLINGKPTVPFKYFDKGTLATIGRNRAVADLGKLKFQGFFAWIVWMFVHIMSLVGFSNKASVLTTWAINYFSKNSDNRLIVRYFDTQTMMTEPIAK